MYTCTQYCTYIISLLSQSSGNDAELLSLVDAIAQSSSPYSTHLLTQHILQSQYSNDLLVRRVLYYLTTTLTPDEVTLVAVRTVCLYMYVSIMHGLYYLCYTGINQGNQVTHNEGVNPSRYDC